MNVTNIAITICKTSNIGTTRKNLAFCVLCLKMYIAKNPPSAPPNADNNSNVDSGTLNLLCFERFLSIPKVTNVTMFIKKKYSIKNLNI